VHLDGHDNLLLGTGATLLAQRAPVIYQQNATGKSLVAGRYRLLEQNTVGFTIAGYDHSRGLVIDPLVYSTYLGGSGTDVGTAIAADAEGNAYVTGSTTSTNFPVSAKAGRRRPTGSGGTVAFVAKVRPDGGTLLYATYLGGSGSDAGTGIAVDGQGDAFISGNTSSHDFPITPGVAQRTYGGGDSDAFVAELNPDGSSLEYASYLGGSHNDTSGGIAVDGTVAGAAYVVGTTASADFPVTPGAPQRTYRGSGPHAFVARLNAHGRSLAFATYLGGSGTETGNAIAVDVSNANAGDPSFSETPQIAVTGDTTSRDFPTTRGVMQPAYPGGGVKAFVAALKPDGKSLLWATYLGGNGTEHGRGIALDGIGELMVTGSTTSRNFPVTPDAVQRRFRGNADAFVVQFNDQDGTLDYATYVGGSGSTGAHAIAADGSDIYIAGGTDSRDLATTPGAVQRRYRGGGDAFVALLRYDNVSYSLHATYLGGRGAEEGNGIAVGTQGRVYVTGDTRSTDFPISGHPAQRAFGSGGTDGFVTGLTLP
jgi:hypothetical protein